MCSSEITILLGIDKRLKNIKGTGIVGLAAVVGLCMLWRAVGNFDQPALFSLE
jgi:hypothetical protein